MKRKSKELHELTKYKEFGPATKNPPDVWFRIHYKEYPRFKSIKLNKNFKKTKLNFEKVLEKRRSERDFKNKPITLDEISKILYYTCGISKKEKDLAKALRMNPSAGARHPLEVYPLILNSKDIPKGLYHYNIKQHSLELILDGDLKKEIFKSLNQDWVKNTSMILLISAIFERTQTKYGERGYRFVFIDAGHMIQNTYLVATSMKMGCCTIGGFIDDKLNKLIDVDGVNESVIYIAGIGHLR